MVLSYYTNEIWYQYNKNYINISIENHLLLNSLSYIPEPIITYSNLLRLIKQSEINNIPSSQEHKGSNGQEQGHNK